MHLGQSRDLAVRRVLPMGELAVDGGGADLEECRRPHDIAVASLERLLDRVSLGDMEREDLRLATVVAGMAAQALYHRVETPALQHIAESDQQPVGVEWLHQEIESAFAHRLDRAVQGAVGGNDDNRGREYVGA